jgi:hypothetical protein
MDVVLVLVGHMASGSTLKLKRRKTCRMEKAVDVPVYIPKWMLLIITKEEDILRKDIAFRPTANSVSSYNSKRTKGKIFSLDSSPIPGKGKKMRRQRRSRLEKLIYICSL